MLFDFSIVKVPPGSTESLGVQILKSRGMFAEAKWYWIGVGALLGYIPLFNFLFTLSLTYLNRKTNSFPGRTYSIILASLNMIMMQHLGNLGLLCHKQHLKRSK